MKKKIKKIVLGILMVLLLVPALVGCSDEGDKPAPTPEPQIEFVGMVWTDDYEVGEAFRGGTLKVKENGEYKEIAMTEAMITGFDTSKVGQFEITITYKDFSMKLNLNVVEHEPVIEIESVNITTEYKLNQEFVPGELKIKEDGVLKTIALTKDMVTGFDTTTLGEHEITITYGDLTKTVTINVVEEPKDDSTGWLPWV